MVDKLHTEGAEVKRLQEDGTREVFWKLWGPYLSERQWGTVREDYSADGDVWKAFPFEMSRSRAYRWGEDGILGFTDHWCRLCFSFALWNGRDPILKERLFGLTGPEGNHGEDVKELYYFLESTPTHSYCRAVYLYPQGEFPYDELRKKNATRSRDEREYEIGDTGLFSQGKYFELEVEYAKEDFDDLLIEVTVRNKGTEAAELHLLPTLWFRNTWSWGKNEESVEGRPLLWKSGKHRVMTKHPSLAAMDWVCEHPPEDFLFTENETNSEALFGEPNASPYTKEAFHRKVVNGELDAVNPKQTGTKCAAWYRCEIEGGGERKWRFRLRAASENVVNFGHSFEKVMEMRRKESAEFHHAVCDPTLGKEARNVVRQALSGMLWSKQFYSLVQSEWKEGDPAQPAPPKGHSTSRNPDWNHLFSQDVLLLPDTWEYPYFCAWDLAFHSVSVSRVDPVLAKAQLDLLTREWYMHPNGQFPAYEWNFSDVNPPVHAWAVWRIYRLPLLKGSADRAFLERQFQKLLLNFTWWVNRKDPEEKNLFSGGFLGLDNIGVFDRSKPLPTGGTLKQADGTAWMAFYCTQMLMMALELAQEDAVYEDMASKFFQHFILITHAMNQAGGSGLWDEEDGFYYDLLETEGRHDPLRVRSLVGLVPLLAVAIVPKSYLKRLPDFSRRVAWFYHHRSHMTHHFVGFKEIENPASSGCLLSLSSRDHLEVIFRRMFDEKEFLSPFGFRSLSKSHEKNPYTYWVGETAYSVDYEPGEGKTGMFGGNSNWRGPIWLPMNYLLIESLRIYHRFYGDAFLVEFPTGSGNMVTLGEAARKVTERVARLFLPDKDGNRPCMMGDDDFSARERVLFYEYFHAETGRGCGASHQTGWTALIADLLNLESHWDF